MAKKLKRNYKNSPLDLSHLVHEDPELDPWQRECLTAEGNVALRAGRQVGKSTVIAKKARNFALSNKGVKVLVIAAAQRESSFIFEKMRGEFEILKENVFAEKPTMTKIILKNGSEIYSLPTGRTGFLIRGLTIDLLIADEAAYIPELVWLSVIPMIAVSQTTRKFGWIWVLSTPFGADGYFYEAFKHDSGFKTWHVSSEDCPRIPKSLLERERARLTGAEYRQEWCGEFVDEVEKFFPTELILKCAKKFEFVYSERCLYFLGVDVARYGGDENAFVVSELHPSGRMRIIEAKTTNRKALTDTRNVIEQMHEKYKFNRIFIDDGGIGGGLTDMLIEKFGKKVVGLNNSSRAINKDKRRNRKLLKEDLYSTALTLMEQDELDIINDFSLKASIDSVKFKYTDDVGERRLTIYGKNTHLAEAFVRAIWGIRAKGLKLFVA